MKTKKEMYIFALEAVLVEANTLEVHKRSGGSVHHALHLATAQADALEAEIAFRRELEGKVQK